jgi:PAT family beta-lactamase induction signal transducer AmpG
MQATSPTRRNPWAWIPTLYLAQGLPFAVVNTLSIILYKSLGVSNADIAFYTAWLYLPWVLKPLWGPVVDILRTRRWWIWTMQLLLGAGFAAVGLSLPLPAFFQLTLAFFYLLAFTSATHDIAADGFYMLATTEKEQAFFVGVRSTFFRLALITGQGLLVILAGYIQAHTGLPKVELEVRAQPGAALVERLDVARREAVAAAESLQIVAQPVALEIAPQPRAQAEVAALLAAARAWNQTHGFTRSATTGRAAEQAQGGPSWWTRAVAEPLGRRLRAWFGPETRARAEFAGNIGVAQLGLSRAPGREVVVTVAFKSGDKSVQVAEGARLVFDDANWAGPALVVVQLDPKLRAGTQARFELRSGNLRLSWMAVFGVLVALFVALALYHRWVLPYPESDRPGEARNIPAFLKEFFRTFGAFFRKPGIAPMLLFLLFYRFGEAQLVRMVAPFLLDAREVGGLGLTTGQVGWVYGTVGVIALTCGGLLGGFVVSRRGLKFWLWPMVFIIHVPDAAFIYLAYAQPDSLNVISAMVALEQFGYGFGFTAYMLYMIYIARGPHQTAHYALCTGFMALGMMIPGMWSGWLQELIGYQHFFVWVILATIPSFLVVLLIPLDAEFGRKER